MFEKHPLCSRTKLQSLFMAKSFGDLNCTVTFFNDAYVLQDHTLRTPIGSCKKRDGVYYYLEALKVKNKVNAMASKSLWHKHLDILQVRL